VRGFVGKAVAEDWMSVRSTTISVDGSDDDMRTSSRCLDELFKKYWLVLRNGLHVTASVESKTHCQQGLPLGPKYPDSDLHFLA
jgi:hypothetical protein